MEREVTQAERERAIERFLAGAGWEPEGDHARVLRCLLAQASRQPGVPSSAKDVAHEALGGVDREGRVRQVVLDLRTSLGSFAWSGRDVACRLELPRLARKGYAVSFARLEASRQSVTPAPLPAFTTGPPPPRAARWVARGRAAALAAAVGVAWWLGTRWLATSSRTGDGLDEARARHLGYQSLTVAPPVGNEWRVSLGDRAEPHRLRVLDDATLELDGVLSLHAAEPVEKAGELLDGFRLAMVGAADVEDGGALELVTIAMHARYSPCFVRVFRADSSMAASYLNDGAIHASVVGDLDGDGNRELWVGGVNVGLGRPLKSDDVGGEAFVAKLDAPSAPVQAPGDGAEVPFALPPHAVTLGAAWRFPATAGERGLSERPEVRLLAVTPEGGLRVTVNHSGWSSEEGILTPSYVLDSTGTARLDDVDDGFRSMFRRLRTERPEWLASARRDPRVATSVSGLAAVERWDGRRWVPSASTTGVAAPAAGSVAGQ